MVKLPEYHFFDSRRTYSEEEKVKYLSAASKAAIFYGFKVLSEDQIRQFWDDELLPKSSYIETNIKISEIKSFIHDYVNIDDEIWNNDFIGGLTSYGKILDKSTRYPSFTWHHNDMLKEIIRLSPFGGRLKDRVFRTGRNIWSFVPALCLSYSEDSLSFFAGVFATGDIGKKDGYTYAKYNKATHKYLEEWGIPIERESKRGHRFFISPFWPALFSLKMPEEIRKKWCNIKKPAKAELYATVLWKTYVNNYFPKKAIPYLRSRRFIYYKYKGAEGAMRKIEMIRVQMGLVELHNNIKGIIRLWNQKHEEQKSKS
jgi:hypothetical protein